jgi:hypothetical protein
LHLSGFQAMARHTIHQQATSKLLIIDQTTFEPTFSAESATVNTQASAGSGLRSELLRFCLI